MTRPDPATASLRLPPPPPADPARIALFLDLDGTLLEFAARPESVTVPTGLRDTLLRLHERLHGALAVLSGRALDDIDALLGLPTLLAAGVHGAQWRDGIGQAQLLPGLPARVHARAAREAKSLPGVLLEDKGTSLALHFRQDTRSAPAVQRLAQALAREAGERFELQPGDCVIEIKPRSTDKGLALARFMALPRFRGRQPWMLGDDHTDEHAFAAANARDGVSVVVGDRRPTQARHALHDPVAVRDWLEQLANRQGGNDP